MIKNLRPSQSDVDVMIRLHKLWLNEDPSGKMANFKRMKLDNIRFSGEDLRQAQFKGASLAYTKFDGANLAGAKMDRVNLLSASFINANMPDVSLCDANCREANFKGANLQRVYIQDTNLYYANFDDANLSYATIWQTIICRTSMRNTNLVHANILDSSWPIDRRVSTNAKVDGAFVNQILHHICDLQIEDPAYKKLQKDLWLFLSLPKEEDVCHDS